MATRAGRSFWWSALAAIVILSVGAPAGATGFDGEWRGQGRTERGVCPAFDILVSVSDNRIAGRAVQAESAYAIDGTVTEDGKVSGEVVYLWLTVAELSGEVGSGQGFGRWRTVKGPDCTGSFTIKRF